LLIVCSEHSPRRILLSEVKYHRHAVFRNSFWGGGKVAQTMYTHVNKCKNDFKKEKKKRNSS
jgi:hypothetical protein